MYVERQVLNGSGNVATSSFTAGHLMEDGASRPLDDELRELLGLRR